MPSVYRGSPYTFEVHFQDGAGNLVAAVNARITISDPLNVQVIVDAAPTANPNVGIYQFAWTPAVNALLGNWEGAWQGVVSGQGLGPLSEIVQVIPVGAILAAPSSSYTYDLTTPTGKVRMYIDDRDMSSVSLSIPLEQRSAIFSDEEIGIFLADSSTDVLYASARALMTIAVNRQLLVQSRRIGKTMVDYGSARRDLVAQAKELISLAASQPADGLAEMGYTDFATRRIVTNVVLRLNR